MDLHVIFAAFQMDTVPITYNVGDGDRLVERSEVVYSWNRAEEQAGLF